MVYVWAILLLLANLLAWGSTLFGVPGNWLVLMFSLVYYFALPAKTEPRLGMTVLMVSLVLAILGEVWEFVAGAAGAARKGGSRRGAILAIAGSMVGSVAGAIVASPLAVVGPMIGALLGGAVGAFAGAYLGERDRKHSERMEIGKGAAVGRLFGTAGKLIFGLIMVILIAVNSFV